MVAKVHALGRSFAGVAAYCLHDAPDRFEGGRPETDERVEWAETRNLASRPERAAGQMAATANAAPELKRLAGVSAAGRKLEKPVVHYTLSWAKDERPDRAEMNRAAEETLKALGLERHQALIVAHNDKTHPHVHLVVNRVDPATGKAAKLGNDRLKLANWAERWERDRGGLRCPERVTNRKKREANKKRGVRKYVKDRKSLHTARHRRERMRQPTQQRWPAPPAPLRDPAHRQRWAELERGVWNQYQEARREQLAELSGDCRRLWRDAYANERAERAAVEKLAAGGVGDRLRLARISDDGDWGRLHDQEERGGRFGGKLRRAWEEARELGVRGSIEAARRTPAEVQRRALEQLDQEHRLERARRGRWHTRLAVDAESDAGEVYFEAKGEARGEALQMAGQEQRDREASRPRPQIQRPRGPELDRGGGYER